MEPLDLKKIAVEVSIQHGIRVDADDPIMAVVTLNRIVFEQSVGEVLERLQRAAEKFEESAERVQVRAGAALAQEVKDCTAALNEKVAEAAASAGDIVAHRAYPIRQTLSRHLVATALAAALFGSGVWVGGHISIGQLAGR